MEKYNTLTGIVIALGTIAVGSGLVAVDHCINNNREYPKDEIIINEDIPSYQNPLKNQQLDQIYNQN